MFLWGFKYASGHFKGVSGDHKEIKWVFKGISGGFRRIRGLEGIVLNTVSGGFREIQDISSGF